MAAEPEVELKFRFAEQELTKIKAFISAAAGVRDETRQRLRTTYFDTPTQDLWRNGLR